MGTAVKYIVLLKKITLTNPIKFVCCVGLICLVFLANRALHTESVRYFWDKDFRFCKSYQSTHFKIPTDSAFATINVHGRLGNWMYSYASLWGIAARTNHVAFLSELHPLRSVFHLSIMPNMSTVCMETVEEKWGCAFDADLLDIPRINVTIDGYLQSWKYFQSFESAIRREFQFKRHILATASEHSSRTVSPRTNRTYICVHIRRTDMMIPSSTSRGFKVAPRLYLERAFLHMATKFTNSTFFIVTDDSRWSRRNVNFSGYDIVFSPKTFASKLDLCLLSLCNHSIITVGTFGWWGAWLARGHTVYYKDFPVRGSPLDKEFGAEDFFPPEWVALSASRSLKTVLLYMFVCYCTCQVFIN